jgi:drug/metabolite transporter (DMT)-like permease
VTRRAVLRCVLAAVLFGAAAPAAAQLVDSIPAQTLAGLLYLGAGLAVVRQVAVRPPSREAVILDLRFALLAVVTGGAIAPVLLVAGLARTNAASASLLLNAELVATLALAAWLFHEHLGARVVGGGLLIVAAGGVLTWSSGATIDTGAVMVLGACAFWGVDNTVTARIDHLGPEHIVALKAAVAGSVNLALGALLSGFGSATTRTDLVAALLIGAGGYGLSISLWVKGARELGAARGQVIFATAPFVGAGVAWAGFGEHLNSRQVVAVVLAAAGVLVSLRSSHQHRHRHVPTHHEHEHVHDDGHHQHHEGTVSERHTHAHEHVEVVHAHPHVPDLHHSHRHVD